MINTVKQLFNAQTLLIRQFLQYLLFHLSYLHNQSLDKQEQIE